MNRILDFLFPIEKQRPDSWIFSSLSTPRSSFSGEQNFLSVKNHSSQLLSKVAQISFSPRGRSEREVQVAKRQKMKILLSWIWSSHSSSSRSRAFNFVLRWIIELLLARRWRAKFMLEQLLGGAKLLSLIATVECFRQFYGVRPVLPVPVLEEKIEHLLWISDKQTTQRKRRSSRKSYELLSEPDLFYVLQSWAQPGSLSLLYKVVIYLRKMSKLNEICASRREPRPQKSAYRCS